MHLCYPFEARCSDTVRSAHGTGINTTLHLVLMVLPLANIDNPCAALLKYIKLYFLPLQAPSFIKPRHICRTSKVGNDRMDQFA